jgi:sulfite reductase (NADPH) flavoprotein alpha-component
LLFGADILIQIASYLMLFIVLAAPFLAWPVLRNNLTGWHRGLGWVLLPVVLMLPLTGVLMSQHIGMPELPRMSQSEVRLSLQDALTMAQQSENLGDLHRLRRFRGGSVLLKMHSGQSERLLVVTDHSVTPINPDSGLIKTLHEGTWAGPWSGAINLLGAATLSLLTITGSLSWLRRRRKHAQVQARRAAAQTVA